jgi:hypothetical protein
LNPQFGSETLTHAFERLANCAGVNVTDAILSKIENLGALLVALKDCPTVSCFLATVFLYFKTHYNKSVANTVANYMSELLETEYSPQSGTFGPVEDEKPAWLLLLKDLQANWTLVIRNEGFSKISHLLSLCLALGLCDASSLDFKIGNLKMFSIGAMVKHASAIDLVDAALETVVYFAEGGYMCFLRKSIKPLLYGNMENEQFEEAYSKCFRCQEYARCGNLEKYENMSENDYEALLAQCIEKASTLIATSRGIVEKNILLKKLEVLRRWQATFRQTRVEGGLREAPYSIGIYGGTAVGKSTIANILMITTLLKNGFSASDDRIVTLNEADRFMSNYRSFTNGVLIDDVGNTKAQFVQRSPTDLIIQLVNNVRMYAVMAEADMKGKVSVEPKVVITTKNVKDTCATVYSNEPASITRRDRITLTCTVRDIYARHGMLAEDKIRAIHKDDVPAIPDFWEIKVEKSYPIPSTTKNAPAQVGWETVCDDAGPMESVSIVDLIRWIGKDSASFYQAQKLFVSLNNDLSTKLSICAECGYPKPDVCRCRKPTSTPCAEIKDDDCPFFGWCVNCQAVHRKEDVPRDDWRYDFTPEDVVTLKSLGELSRAFDIRLLAQWLRDNTDPEDMAEWAVAHGMSPDHFSESESSSVPDEQDSYPAAQPYAPPKQAHIPLDQFSVKYGEELLCEYPEWQMENAAISPGRYLSHVWYDHDDKAGECLATRSEVCAYIEKYKYELGPILDEQVGEILFNTCLPWYQRYYNYGEARYTKAFEFAETTAAKLILKRLDWLENSLWVVWTNWIPTEWLDRPWMKDLVFLSHEEKLRTRIAMAYRNHICIMFAIVFISFKYNYNYLVLLLLSMSALSDVVRIEKRILYDQVVADNAAMPHVWKMRRDAHVKWIAGVCALVGVLYAVAQVYKLCKVVAKPQGNLAPTSEQDIVVRDSEVNPWAGVKITPMPCMEKSKTTTPERLESIIKDNLCYMDLTYTKDGKTIPAHCNAFFIKSNVALIPQHMWKVDDMKAKFVRHDPKLIGGNFECYLFKKHSVQIQGTDLCLVWVPNGGDWKDVSDYFPLERFRNSPARLIYKKMDGTYLISKLMMAVGTARTYASTFYGAYYDLTFNTFDGLCMSPILTETKGPLIGGFHLGGKEGTTKGCCGTILRSQLDQAFEQLKGKSTLLLAKSSGVIPKEQYDVQYYQGPTVHHKSPINFLPEGTNCKYYGQVTGRASYNSEVESTIISPLVAKHCGVPQQWAGPKFRTGYPWQASLQFSAKPACGLEGSLLEKASNDYYEGVIEAMDRLPHLKVAKPLTEMETVCGIDARRFVDKMPASTSIGFPLSGPKSNYLTLLDPEDHPTHQCPAVLDQRFWDCAAEMEEKYLAGERAYPIFKACLKDEPTKMTKDKVRVFQGAPIAMQLLVRKYFLPMARILSIIPLVSECAVGINAQGPEWDQLAKHIRKYGEDRILAGDYAKYDLRLPAQVMFASFRIMMDMAKHCGYSDRDLEIMEGIATDICYPLMAYNGDLIQHIGSNPSGQNLTVYVNSLCGSLLMRCAYFYILRDHERVPAFRKVCALTTYGDDVKGSVKKDYPEFNHISVADFLKERDIIFTMPDKTSTPTPYMTDASADFLKRHNIYCEDTGMIMGALDEGSIFKSLHAVLKSTAITKEQQAMFNIDGALREWFQHGREVYEKRRAQMIEIAKEADIIHGCTVVHETYDDRLAEWKEKYCPDKTPPKSAEPPKNLDAY